MRNGKIKEGEVAWQQNVTFFSKKWIFLLFLNFLLNFFVEKVYFRNVLGGFVSFCWSDHVFDMAEYDFRPAHSMDYHKRTARPM